MNKVMSRTEDRPARPRHRPPTRRDSRRPAGAPPRNPVRGTAEVNAARVVAEPRPTDLFAERLLAVLSGRRPVHWMLRYTAGSAYDELSRLAARRPLPAPAVQDIGYYVPRDGALEVFARVTTGAHLRALAFRLELGPANRWRCTALSLPLPGNAADHDA
ncbi:hypothetical protein KUM39_08050 [Streptomyces sp. J2-1]|uniref:Rv3235 family protein n=1 Tax=Streptomyces corallincola TaxID=2851888 RepID=UPI001C38ADB6|nr:Rv3235 family protein [Streptomyces corallincola]MBV2354316.1 hypothetical protein [Streptomyces corallincola]